MGCSEHLKIEYVAIYHSMGDSRLFQYKDIFCSDITVRPLWSVQCMSVKDSCWLDLHKTAFSPTIFSKVFVILEKNVEY